MASPFKIFIAYSHRDKPLLQKLRTHLNVMKRQQHCEIFFDGEIMPGETWDKRLKDELHAADIFVLLVTEDFLDSDYVNETELPKILERRSRGEAEVVPVILKDCLWDFTELQHLQVVLKDGHPIELNGSYAHAARQVFRVIEARNENLRQAREAAEAAEAARRQQAERQSKEKEEAERQLRRSLDPFHDLMLPIKGGTFKMGDEHGDLWKACRPVHEVTVNDFQLCKYPVTQAAWKKIMGDGNNPSHFKGNDLPVEWVNWDDVQAFIKKLNENTEEKYRLPSEAEWEFAARGGNQSNGYQYAGSNNVNEVAWYTSNSNSKTHPVGGKKKNELGLYDMSGNVWEWCQDVWHENYKGAPTDGSAWLKGGDQDYRVMRGGSWFFGPPFCRTANRGRARSAGRSSDVGFRLVSLL